MLKFENVVKRYKDLTALNKISFEIKKGAVFGLLGPNGAGKTTLIRIINGILAPDEGEIFINGEKLKPAHSQKIGYLPEERGLYPDMKVYETLSYLGKLKGLTSKKVKESIDYWMKEFDILHWKHKKIKELSKGMQQKVQFIVSILHNPDIIILDEPFTGLDPVNTQMIKQTIQRLNAEGKTIIFSTHRMEQVEDICRELVLINKGEIILSGAITDIKQKFKKNIYLVEYQGTITASSLENYEIIKVSDKKIYVRLKDNKQVNSFLQTVLMQAYIKSFVEILPSLNEIFIEKVGGKSEE